MGEQVSRLLVVDASVIGSAGVSEHPMSSSCRNWLQEILRICHRVAVTPAIRDEWKRHMTDFSHKWLCSMHARRKIQQFAHVEVESVPIDMAAYSNAAYEEIKKDLCLLEAALAADRIIVTRDEALKAALNEEPDGRALLRTVTWFNPVNDGPEALETL